MERHVILTDDDPDDCYLFSSICKEVHQNTNITCLHEGQALLDHLSEKDHPDIIFLDLNMKPMSGLECLQKLRENLAWKKIPIIIYSTSSHPETIHQCISLGANSYVVKPDTVDKLKEMFSKTLEIHCSR